MKYKSGLRGLSVRRCKDQKKCRSWNWTCGPKRVREKESLVFLATGTHFKSMLYLVLTVPSSADQSSTRSLSHRYFSPERSVKSLAFLLLWLSGLRLESGMNPQGTVWKSLSRQGNWSLLYNVGTWEFLDLSYGEQTLVEMVSISQDSPWNRPAGCCIA